MIDYLDFLQKINNGFHKVLGDRSIVIDLQIYINAKRNELDIPDPDSLIGEYVQ